MRTSIKQLTINGTEGIAERDSHYRYAYYYKVSSGHNIKVATNNDVCLLRFISTQQLTVYGQDYKYLSPVTTCYAISFLDHADFVTNNGEY